MTDFTRLMCLPPPADWTNDGIFRAAYLALFDTEDRAALRRAGKALAVQAYSGDTPEEPEVVGPLRAALEDVRMLATFLREIGESTEATTPARARQLAGMAEGWSREVGDLALAIRRALGAEP
jgi:hypothetical protein